MRYTELFVPTLRETPADAEVASHALMLRAGYIRKVASGVYSYLPLCLRVLRKIEAIVREEMSRSGAQELLLPMVMPKELWEEAGRWSVYGKELLRFRDRHNHDFCIGPTHEEAMTDLIRNEIRSYRGLPKNCFQIQTKFRDEIRPRFGLMRGREFIMKDGYSFDRDEKGALLTYGKMYEAYTRIFSRCGLQFRPVEATTGTIGGSRSHEFQVLAASGEDEIVACTKCEYAANVEKAELPSIAPPKKKARRGAYRKVATPNAKSVEEVCTFLRVSADAIVKTLIFETDRGPVAGLVRGDHTLKEAKLKEAIGALWCHFADEEVVRKVTGAPSGFAGPVKLSIPIYADQTLLTMDSFVCGANEEDAHLVEVTLGDISVERFLDIRRAVAGDPCPRCRAQLEEHRGIEVGQVFYLGTKYSLPMKAFYLDERGQSEPMVMGCYGIGIGRTAAAAIEQNHDERGIMWPYPIAPYQLEILPLDVDAKGNVFETALRFYEELSSSGIEVLLDDRDVRAGVKFADADLIGIPFHLVVGAKGLGSGTVEIKERKTGSKTVVGIDEVVPHLKHLFESLK